MRTWTAIGATVAAAFLGAVVPSAARQTPTVLSVDQTVIREYAGVYQWGPNAFVYLQIWDEGKPGQLVAFDESGEVRTLYPTGRDQFFAGPGFAVSTSVESRIEFQRVGGGKITSLTWQRAGAARACGQTGRHRETRGRLFLEWRRSARRHAHLSGRRREAPCDHSRAWLRRRESRHHPSFCAVPCPPRHRGARVRQAGRRWIDRGLEHGLVRRSGRRRGGRLRVPEDAAAISTARRLDCWA